MIQNKELIEEVLDNAEFGVLALCGEKPYAVPVNFVYLDNAIYFHGSLTGKKMEIMKTNPNTSFNIVTNHSVLPSYIMSDDALACPATAFFKSITIDGVIEIIENTDAKRKIFAALMNKLQPEGNYLSFDSGEYNMVLDKTAVLKIKIEKINAKFKFGQNYSKSKRERIITNLKKRNKPNDEKIIRIIKSLNEK